MRSTNMKGSVLSSGVAVFLLAPALIVFAMSQTACTEFNAEVVDVIADAAPEQDTAGTIVPVEDTREAEPDVAEEGEDALADEGEDILAQGGEDVLAVDTGTGRDVLEEADTRQPYDVLSVEADTVVLLDCPGAAGCDCEEPDECLSGFCAPTSEGSKCARMCATGAQCDDDQICTMYKGASGPDSYYVCLDRWPTACKPCVEDTDCTVGWLDDDRQPVCVDDAKGGRYCAPRPNSDNPEKLECPEDFIIGAREIKGQSTDVCFKADGQCECKDLWLRTGAETICSQSNENGTCIHRHLCDEVCQAAYPEREHCDGKDNNCDGVVDEELDGSACEISNNYGTCVGVLSCANGIDLCIGKTPLVEQCNGIDDDCDGLTDEELGTTMCGQGICKHVIENCRAGVMQVCNPFQGATREQCNNIDDDCDGSLDEDLGMISCGIGVCFHSVPACKNGKPNTCIASAFATTESCDNKDNDCDGSIDEGFGQVTCGIGACKHSIMECVNGRNFVCDPLEGSLAETCNGLDDDCDGVTDNSLSAPAKTQEPNDTIAYANKLGFVTEGEPTTTFHSYAYMGKDQDWFAFTGDEIDHGCIWGTDQDFKVYITLFSPTGPEACIPLLVELYDAKGNKLAGPVVANCTAASFEYKWDGECGPDDSKDFRLKIYPYNERKYSCLPYTLNLTMKKL